MPPSYEDIGDCTRLRWRTLGTFLAPNPELNLAQILGSPFFCVPSLTDKSGPLKKVERPTEPSWTMGLELQDGVTDSYTEAPVQVSKR